MFFFTPEYNERIIKSNIITSRHFKWHTIHNFMRYCLLDYIGARFSHMTPPNGVHSTRFNAMRFAFSLGQKWIGGNEWRKLFGDLVDRHGLQRPSTRIDFTGASWSCACVRSDRLVSYTGCRMTPEHVTFVYSTTSSSWFSCRGLRTILVF